MEKKSNLLEALRGLSYLTQVGLSVATPIVLCLLAARWLQSRFAWGSWVLFAGLLIGLTSGLVSLWKFLRLVERKSARGAKSQADEKPDDGRKS